MKKDYADNNGGSVRQDKTVAMRKRRSGSLAASGVADWSSCPGELIAKAIGAITRNGGAVRFGYSRDGGAYAIGIYGDGDPFTEYFSPDTDMYVVLQGLADDYAK